MKFKQLTHYVESSFEDKPSFIIELVNAIETKTFISNGCVFKELTEENIELLIEEHDCEEYINELLNSPASIEDVVDGEYMFYGCREITSFKSNMPNLKDGRSMFRDCKELTYFEAGMPNLEYGNFMFENCEELILFKSDTQNLEYVGYMFDGCDKLKGESHEI